MKRLFVKKMANGQWWLVIDFGEVKWYSDYPRYKSAQTDYLLLLRYSPKILNNNYRSSAVRGFQRGGYYYYGDKVIEQLNSL